MVYADRAEEFGEGRCVNCGLLALIRIDGAVTELSMAVRMGWENTSDPPRCLVYQRHLAEELVKWGRDRSKSPEQGISEIIRLPQTCAKWSGYIEGLSPQEHLRRQDQMELEDLRQRQTAMALQFAEKQVDISNALKATVDKQAEMAIDAGQESGRFNRLFALLGAATLVLALATLVFPNGVPHLTVSNGGGNPQPVTVVLTVALPSPPTLAGTLTVTPSAQPTPSTVSSPTP